MVTKPPALKARWINPAAGTVLLPVLCMLLTGCADDNPLRRQSISGNVTLDGQPIKIGTIRFSPHEHRGVASGGPIDNGRYAVEANQGLPPGKYLVKIYATQQDNAVVENEPPGLATQKPGIDLIPARYNSRSELVREVTTDGDNQFDFELESK